MNKQNKLLFYFRNIMLITFAVLLCGIAVFAQQDNQPKSRDIVPVFEKSRPSSGAQEAVGKVKTTNNSGKKTPVKTTIKIPKKPVYKRVSTRVSSGKVSKTDRPNKRRPTKTTQPDIAENRSRQIGITLWQLSEVRPQTNLETLLENADGKKRYLLPERVSIDTIFEPYDLVRFTVESSRRGYLYIIDQEMFADGTIGDAYLVFPSKRINNGINLIAPGKPIELPDLKGNPFYFELRPENQNGDSLTAEILTVIITDQPIPGVKIGEIPSLIIEKTLESWRTKWVGRVEIFETDEHADYTKNEKNAANGNITLNADDPLPQTVFMVEANANGGSLITVPLWYGDN